AERARQIIYNMTRKLNEGEVYVGRVTRIIQIGAFVEVLPGKEGMIHISQLAEGRVGRVEDEVAVGDEVVVKVREIDAKGRLNLTRLGIHPDEAAAARRVAQSPQ
ncbi:MAG: S1 RNA-binding domain-containing protein, partial [Microcystaceae cyanobacterium]